MITWMQRHKKWLVITIWISTLAFVGAGFVGWGSYNFGSSSGSIATIGEMKVKQTDLQNEYNSLYRQYETMFGQSFNKELAKQLKLEQVALNGVIQKFLLLNYANELGLYTTDTEVAKYLLGITSFHKDGKFDKNTYLQVLKQNRTTPQEFENQIKKELLLNKVQAILATNINQVEINNIDKLFSVEDRVKINIVLANQFKIDQSNAKIKQYWEANKNNYKTLETTNLELSKVAIGKDIKTSNKDALRMYLKIKKGELKFEQKITIDKNSKLFSAENLNKVLDAAIDDIIKPLEEAKYYYIVKIVSKQGAQPLNFDKAFESVKQDYIKDEKNKLLKDKVSQLLAQFNGNDVGFINYNDKKPIKNLSDDESSMVKKSIQNSTTKINSIMLDNKAVVYEIIDSRFTEVKADKNIQTIVQNIKNNEIISKLLEKLQNTYTVTTNVKVQ